MNITWDLGKDVTYEILIANLGGYKKAKEIIGECIAQKDFYNADRLKHALLQYRRENEIYDIDDYVVYKSNAGLDGLFQIENLTKKGKPKTVKTKRFGNFPCRYCEVQHATDAEIKANKREVG